jgi:hypothetical protein
MYNYKSWSLTLRDRHRFRILVKGKENSLQAEENTVINAFIITALHTT